MMPIFIDPFTRQRVLTSEHVGDINYDLTGDAAISQETLSLIGPWSDFTGSDATVNSATQQRWAGGENQLQGTDADIDFGAKLGQLNVIGERKKTTRRRTIKRNAQILKGGKVVVQ